MHGNELALNRKENEARNEASATVDKLIGQSRAFFVEREELWRPSLSVRTGTGIIPTFNRDGKFVENDVAAGRNAGSPLSIR